MGVGVGMGMGQGSGSFSGMMGGAPMPPRAPPPPPPPPPPPQPVGPRVAEELMVPLQVPPVILSAADFLGLSLFLTPKSLF